MIQSSRSLRPPLQVKSYLLLNDVDISKRLGDEFDKSARCQNHTTVNEIEKRERDGIPKKTHVVGKGLLSLG